MKKEINLDNWLYINKIINIKYKKMMEEKPNWNNKQLFNLN